MIDFSDSISDNSSPGPALRITWKRGEQTFQGIFSTESEYHFLAALKKIHASSILVSKVNMRSVRLFRQQNGGKYFNDTLLADLLNSRSLHQGSFIHKRHGLKRKKSVILIILAVVILSAVCRVMT